MKLKITVTSYFEIDELPNERVWPECKTIEDVAKFQQKCIDEGCSWEDVLGDDYIVKVEVG